MAELPGMEEKDVEVKLSNGILTIKGEKRNEKEERQKDYMAGIRQTCRIIVWGCRCSTSEQALSFGARAGVVNVPFAAHGVRFLCR
jgi:hypothetical protein